MSIPSLKEFLASAYSPYHVVKEAVDILVKNGFKHVRESEGLP